MGAARLTRKAGKQCLWFLRFQAVAHSGRAGAMCEAQPTWQAVGTLITWQELTWTTEMCPCSTAKVSEVQCRLSG